jgi:hypothetical protein
VSLVFFILLIAFLIKSTITGVLAVKESKS